MHLGPTCQEKNMRSGQVHILKGLVLPQWKLRDLVIIGENLFLYPGKVYMNLFYEIMTYFNYE